jgi:hypothetical protein
MVRKGAARGRQALPCSSSHPGLILRQLGGGPQAGRKAAPTGVPSPSIHTLPRTLDRNAEM